MPRASSIRAMVGSEIKQAAPVRQHRDGPRHKESDLPMPSRDPMRARLAFDPGQYLRISSLDATLGGEAI
jgi:hypothetical protein